MPATVHRLHDSRAIGVIAAGGLVAQTLTLEEYRGMIMLALLSCEKGTTTDVGLSASASANLWAKLAAKYPRPGRPRRDAGDRRVSARSFKLGPTREKARTRLYEAQGDRDRAALVRIRLAALRLSVNLMLLRPSVEACEERVRAWRAEQRPGGRR